MKELSIGIKNKSSVTVTEINTAKAMGSGELEVFATPSMLALMEGTAAQSVSEFIGESNTTVGSKADISHLAPTPVGMTVECESELIEIDGKRLVFCINVKDKNSLVGKGIHERYIVNKAHFCEKAYNKLNCK